MSLGLVLTAAGSGTRYQGQKDKLLEEINGIPILILSLNAFTHLEGLSEVIVTASRSNKSQFEGLISKQHFPFSIKVIEGGDTRRDSVEKGVNALPNATSILIHDAARPNLSKGLIDRLLTAHQTNDAVIPGIAVADTIKEVRNNIVSKTIPRQTLIRVQTPQLFKRDLLLTAYAKPHSEEMTDEAMLIEALPHPVFVVEGDAANVKVTVKEDLRFLK